MLSFFCFEASESNRGSRLQICQHACFQIVQLAGLAATSELGIGDRMKITFASSKRVAKRMRKGTSRVAILVKRGVPNNSTSCIED